MTDKVKHFWPIALYSLFSGYAIVEQLLNEELTLSLYASFAFAVIIFLFIHFYEDVKAAVLHEKLFCAVFALVTVICESFWRTGSFDYLIGNLFADGLAESLFSDSEAVVTLLSGKLGTLITVAATVARTVGIYCLSLLCIRVLKRIFNKIKNTDRFGKVCDFLFGKHAFIKIFLVLILLWSPYLIVKLPASVSSDATWQISQVFGETEYTTHHPLFATWIIGGTVWLGSKILSFSFGLFLCELLQYAVMASVFAYSIVEISKFRINKVYPLCLVVGYAIFPCFGNTVSTVGKDAFFCALFTLFIVKLILVIREYSAGAITVKSALSLMIVGLLVSLFRNNGIYAVAPALLVLVLMILGKKNLKKKAVNSVVILTALVLFFGFNFVQKNILEVEQGSIAEALSIPFQQTARYVKEYGDEVTEDEKAAIDAVLDYENLAEDYNPTVSDPVKGKYKGDNSKLLPYFKVWFSQFLKHPLCYFEATLNQSYPAFYLDVANTRSYKPFTDGSGEDYAQVSQFSMLRTLLLGYSAIFSMIPIVSQLVNPVLYIWIFIYLIFYAFSRKKRKSYVILLPLFITLWVVIAGPAVMNNARYLYPIAWSIPFVIPYFTEKSNN